MARTTQKLTDNKIKNAKITDENDRLYDGDRLHLFISKSGSKLWRFNYYKPFSKKRTEISLGKYPEVSLAQARKARDEYLSLLAQGIDPRTYRQQLEQQSCLSSQNTFKVICEKWFTEIYPTKAHNEETRLKNWARLENHIFPKIADLPLEEIKPRLLIEIYRGIGASNTLDKICNGLTNCNKPKTVFDRLCLNMLLIAFFISLFFNRLLS